MRDIGKCTKFVVVRTCVKILGLCSLSQAVLVHKDLIVVSNVDDNLVVLRVNSERLI